MNRGTEIARLARQLRNEEEDARPLIELLRRDPHAELPEGCATAGFVHVLTNAAREMHQRAPETSELLARRATAAAAALDAAYPRVLRAQFAATAWKELASAKRFRSDCESALHALDRAEAAIENEPALAHDRAILALARAVTLRDMNRVPEAQALLAPAANVFEEHGDTARVAQCELLSGMILHARGGAQEAIVAYRRALDAARASGDVRTVASALIDIGIVEAEEGRTNAALDALQQARAIFRDLHADAEVARANWGVGLALLTASRFEAAIPVLRDARRAFLASGLIEEAGLAGVELAEAYIALDRHAAAHRMIVAVTGELRAARLNERALVALAYLRDLGTAARAESARHVYTYLSRLRREPQLLFLPPE